MGQELLLDSVQGTISPKWGFHVMTSLSPDHHGLESITKGSLRVSFTPSYPLYFAPRPVYAALKWPPLPTSPLSRQDRPS